MSWGLPSEENLGNGVWWAEGIAYAQTRAIIIKDLKNPKVIEEYNAKKE